MRFVEIALLCTLPGAAMAHEHNPFNRIYVFGDSYSDIGEGYLDGNGPTAVAYLARDLGIELVPSDKAQSAKQSLDFAVSGAQTGRGNGKKIGSALLGFGMENQVEEFEKRVSENKIRFDARKTLFFIAGGLNDRKLPTATTVRNLKDEIRTLYQTGGRHFELALMPTAIPSFSEVGQRLNPALALIPRELKPELPAADIRLSQWGHFFDQVMRNPSQYGIHDTTHPCAGREIFNQDATPCANPNKHFLPCGSSLNRRPQDRRL